MCKPSINVCVKIRCLNLFLNPSSPQPITKPASDLCASLPSLRALLGEPGVSLAEAMFVKPFEGECQPVPAAAAALGALIAMQGMLGEQLCGALLTVLINLV